MDIEKLLNEFQPPVEIPFAMAEDERGAMAEQKRERSNIITAEDEKKRPGPTGRVTDPWTRVTDKLAIVAFSKTTRDLAPFDDLEWEIWGLNEEYRFKWMKRWDRWFQLHPEDDFNRKGNPNDPRHPEWLRKQKPLGEPKAFPIYMQRHFDYIAPSYAFPLEQIKADLGIDYYTSSVAYMLGLGAWMGYKEISLYGVEMASDTEYRYQRPNGEFWLGFLMGRGIRVVLPEAARLLIGKRYGFEWIPNIGRQAIEFDLHHMKEQEHKEFAKLNSVLGMKNFVEQNVKEARKRGIAEDALKPMQDELARAEKAVNDQFGQLNAVAGAKQYISGLAARLDAQVAASFGAEVRLSDREGPKLYNKDGSIDEELKKSNEEFPLMLDVRDRYEGEEEGDEQPPEA